MSRLLIDIDALELKGFAAAEQRVIAEAFRGELARLLEAANSTDFAQGLDSGRSLSVPMTLAAGTPPRETGIRAARAVFGRICR